MKKLLQIIDTTNEPNILQTMKLGRKPIADKKVMLRIFIEQSTVDANGGEQSCKDECVLFLRKCGQKKEKN